MEEILSTGKKKTIYNKTLEKISVTVQNNKIATGRIWKRFKKKLRTNWLNLKGGRSDN